MRSVSPEGFEITIDMIESISGSGKGPEEGWSHSSCYKFFCFSWLQQNVGRMQFVFSEFKVSRIICREIKFFSGASHRTCLFTREHYGADPGKAVESETSA